MELPALVEEYRTPLLASAAIVVVVSVLRALILRWLQRGAAEANADSLRLRSYVRGASSFALGVALIIVWTEPVKELAFSMLALGAAIVLATKEIWTCVMGAVLRASTGSFRIGDRIEIAGMRGYVIAHGLLGTTLLELAQNHQRTGRAVVFPNSLLLASAVINESFTTAYVLHSFTVPVEEESWVAMERKLLDAAQDVCVATIGPAKKHLDEVGRKHGLPLFSVEPRVTIHAMGNGSMNLVVRVPTLASERSATEQQIIRRALGGASSPADEASLF